MPGVLCKQHYVLTSKPIWIEIMGVTSGGIILAGFLILKYKTKHSSVPNVEVKSFWFCICRIFCLVHKGQYLSTYGAKLPV